MKVSCNAKHIARIKAYAKINLYLDVLGKRNDGYHDLVTVMQSVSLCDVITIRVRSGKGIEISTDCTCLPTDHTNIVHRAATVLAQKFDICSALHIHIKKNIPMGAGLGGGSANCAAVLVGINGIFGLELSREELAEIGVGLGADVPFMLHGGTAIARGVGEKLTSLPPHPNCYIVLTYPNLHVSTATAFRELNLSDMPPCNMLSNYEENLQYDLQIVCKSLYNAFEQFALRKFPQIAQAKKTLLTSGALAALMTGTGSAVFAYFDCKTPAQAALDKLIRLGWPSHILQPMAKSLEVCYEKS